MATLAVRPLTRIPERLSLRECDRIECAAGGLTPTEAIAYGIKHSIEALEVLCSDGPVAYIGYRPSSPMGTAAIAWALTTPKVLEHKVAFARASAKYVDKLLELYPEIHVTVDVRHEQAISWLEWLGFRKWTKRQGPFGLFHHMICRRGQWAS